MVSASSPRSTGAETRLRAATDADVRGRPRRGTTTRLSMEALRSVMEVAVRMGVLLQVTLGIIATNGVGGVYLGVGSAWRSCEGDIGLWLIAGAALRNMGVDMPHGVAKTESDIGGAALTWPDSHFSWSTNSCFLRQQQTHIRTARHSRHRGTTTPQPTEI